MILQSLAARSMNSLAVRLTRNIKLNTFPSHLQEPVVSFTFDDAPRSSLIEGGRILKEMGWAGSYYIAGSFCGRRIDGIDYLSRDDLVEADREGHEIGCHTFSHMRLRRETPAAILDDLRRNAEFLCEILPHHKLSSFAYPFGDIHLGNKMLLAKKFPICRGIWDGTNHGRIDFAQLKGVGIESRKNPTQATIEAWLDRAANTNSWLIFFTHDISNNPSPYGCSPDMFARVAESVARRGIKVLTVKNAAGFAAAPLKAIQ